MRTLSKSLGGLFVIAFFLTVASSARADDFSWTYSGTFDSGTLTGSGTLTTGAFSSGSATITDITGTFGGLTITGLAPTGSFQGAYGDNILYSSGSYFDGYGVVFYLTGTNVEGNIWRGYRGQIDSNGTSSEVYLGTFTLTPIGAPEPGTILLLGSGLLMLFGLARLKRQAEPV